MPMQLLEIADVLEPEDLISPYKSRQKNIPIYNFLFWELGIHEDYKNSYSFKTN